MTKHSSECHRKNPTDKVRAILNSIKKKLWSYLASQRLWHDSPWRVLEELCDKNMPGSIINLPVKNLRFLNIYNMFG